MLDFQLVLFQSIIINWKASNPFCQKQERCDLPIQKYILNFSPLRYYYHTTKQIFTKLDDNKDNKVYIEQLRGGFHYTLMKAYDNILLT